MIPKECKRLAEVDFPIAVVSKHSAREKSIRHGHIPRLFIFGGRVGRITAVQPCIRLMRSFDERHHSYQGYVLRIDGTCEDETGEFQIAVGKAAHEKHQFSAGMEVSGLSVPVPDARLETAGLYKTSGIKVGKEAEEDTSLPPPFLGVPPDLETYRSRGHRRLDARTYTGKCKACIWGCRMPVEMIIDQWNPSRKAVPVRDVLLRPEELPTVSGRGHAQSAGAERHVLHRRGLGRRGRHLASRTG
jgi:hypothetical protein